MSESHEQAVPGSVTSEDVSWGFAIIAAVITGIVAAIAYAGISYAIGSEYLMLIIGVGALVGLAVRGATDGGSFLTGLLAAVVAAASIAAAIVLYVAALAGGSFWDAFGRLGRLDLGLIFRAYFEDPLGYVWAGAGLIAAFFFGASTAQESEDDESSDEFGDDVESRTSTPAA